LSLRSGEQAVSALESMDDAVEAAKDALDAYFAGRDEDVGRELFENAQIDVVNAWEVVGPDEPLGPVCEYFAEPDEFETAKANGAYADDFTRPALAD
jgi:hypothetical protein